MNIAAIIELVSFGLQLAADLAAARTGKPAGELTLEEMRQALAELKASNRPSADVMKDI